MSPLLFVMVMEYFNRMLKRVAINPAFRYHLGCKSVGLNCLSFAVYVLVFCKGLEQSVKLIVDAIAEFEGVSGLAANPAKLRIYAGGCKGARIATFCGVTGFSLGEFPMKYLGFPLSPRKWTKGECWRLVEQVTTRVRCWVSRHLSYAGRTVLVQSVLMTMHVYRASTFILPKSVIEEVEKICRGYLWGSIEDKRRPPVVAWDNLCLPKKCGGIGLKHISV